MLTLQLFGHFQLSVDGAAVVLPQARLQSLLAYLALHGQNPQARRQLAFLFWPDLSEERAYNNLRRVLHQLRVVWPAVDQYLAIEHQSIAWWANAPLRLDVADFQECLAQARRLRQSQEHPAAITLFERAVDLYHGPFLPDCYDDWALSQRAALEDELAAALQALADLHEARRAYSAAIGHLQRLLRLDPLHEPTYRQLMRLYLVSGARAGALQLFDECVAILAREVGVEPDAETLALHLQIMQEEGATRAGLSPQLHPNQTSPFIGRHAEWQQLIVRWQQAAHGQAQMVAITGAAGIGKTRLAEAFAEWARRQGVRVASARAYEGEGELPFSPLGELLRAESLAPAFLQIDDVWLSQIARLLPELLARYPKLARPEATADPLQRHHFLEALARLVLAEKRPLLLLVDDLQWAGREALEWLHFLLRYAPQAPLLLLVTIRSGETASDHPLRRLLLSLRQMERLTEMALPPLDATDTAVLAAQIAGHRLETAQSDELYKQTRGNPFFVVEMTRASLAYWQRGDTPTPAPQQNGAPSLALPSRVQAAIQARLAQLTPLAHEVALLAAAIGRSFKQELLAHAGPYGDGPLTSALEELLERHILVEHTLHEEGATLYDFAHPLLRQVSYQQLSPPRARMIHRQIAQAWQTLPPHETESVSAIIATHYEVGGQLQEAIDWQQRAARFAKATYAYQEATAALRHALLLLQKTPPDEARQQRELELMLDLALVLMMLKGFSDAEVEQGYQRAEELCQSAGTTMYLFETVWGLHESYLFRGNYAKAHNAAEHCWHLAQQSGDPELLLQAHHALWGVYFYSYVGPHGLASAVEETQAGLKLYRPEWHLSHTLHYGGHDPSVCACIVQAQTQWLLGYPDQAAASAQEAVTRATRLGHPFSQVVAFSQSSKVYSFRGEAQRVLECWERVLQIIAEYKLPFDATESLVWRGRALSQIKPSAEAVAMIRRGIDLWEEEGGKVNYSVQVALLAEACLAINEVAAAQQALEEAMAFVAVTREDHYRPELYRLHGCCLWRRGEVKAAQPFLQQALELAQQQQAKSLELRAALDLCRLWATEGEPQRAHDLLAPLYQWFTEGFDTADLIAARTLLQTL